METNWIIFIIVSSCIIILLIFVMIQNKKDKKSLTKTLNDDYKPSIKNSESNDDVQQ